MSGLIRAAPALCQTVFVAQQLGWLEDWPQNRYAGEHLKQQSAIWLAGHKNGTSSCLSCSMGLYNQLLIKVAFWNWNSKETSATLKCLPVFFICLAAFSWLYLCVSEELQLHRGLRDNFFAVLFIFDKHFYVALTASYYEQVQPIPSLTRYSVK